MLIVGTDSYVTLEEALAYIEKMYVESINPQMFTSLDTDIQEALLRVSCMDIESISYKGKKASKQQTLSFPRYASSPKVPDPVKFAQIENAVSLSDVAQAEESDFYKKVRENGITAYSLGNLHESFDLSKMNTLQGLSSERAYKYLKPYIVCGVNII